MSDELEVEPPQPVVNETPYAFSIENAALYTGSSVWEIRDALRRGDLTPSYRGTKIRIKRSELEAWVDAMPNERP